MGFTSTQIAVAGLAAGIAGTGFQAYGLYQQSRAAKKQAEYSAAVARNNQIIAQQEAEDIRERGEISADTHRRKVNALKGRQRAVLAEQGHELGAADTSAADILADTALLGELDIETIRSNAAREAYGAEVRAMNYGAQAGLYEEAADDLNPTRTGLTSLLTGAGSVAAQWYQWANTSPGSRRTQSGTTASQLATSIGTGGRS